MRISDWSSDVCSSDLQLQVPGLAVWSDAQLHADELLIHVVEFGVEEAVAAIAGMLAMLEADAQGQLVSAQRQIKGAEYFQIVVIADRAGYRSEEHTSELQSLMRISYAVFCLK